MAALSLQFYSCISFGHAVVSELQIINLEKFSHHLYFYSGLIQMQGNNWSQKAFNVMHVLSQQSLNLWNQNDTYKSPK